MGDSGLHDLSFTCPNCGAVNQLVTSRVRGESRITCTRCHALNGSFRELSNRQNDAARARKDRSAKPAK